MVFNISMKHIAHHPDADLIDRNGGVAAVAKETGYSLQRVSNWRARGIPAEAKIAFPALFLPDLVAAHADLAKPNGAK